MIDEMGESKKVTISFDEHKRLIEASAMLEWLNANASSLHLKPDAEQTPQSIRLGYTDNHWSRQFNKAPLKQWIALRVLVS